MVEFRILLYRYTTGWKAFSGPKDFMLDRIRTTRQRRTLGDVLEVAKQEHDFRSKEVEIEIEFFMPFGSCRNLIFIFGSPERVRSVLSNQAYRDIFASQFCKASMAIDPEARLVDCVIHHPVGSFSLPQSRWVSSFNAQRG